MVFFVLATGLHALLFFGINFGLYLSPIPRLADALRVSRKRRITLPRSARPGAVRPPSLRGPRRSSVANCRYLSKDET